MRRGLIGLLARLAATGAAGVALIGAAAAPASAANVVVNGAFDNNTTGWTGSWYVLNGPDGGFPVLDTAPYFWGGNGASHAITQTYSLTAADLSALGSAGLNYLMSADLFGYSTQADSSTFRADFLDGGDGLLGSVLLTSTTNDPGAWPSSVTAGTAPSRQSVTGSVPGAARSILFTVSASRAAGSSNDGYLDNAVFDLQPVSAGATTVPLPSAGWLLLGGVAALAGVRRRA